MFGPIPDFPIDRNTFHRTVDPPKVIRGAIIRNLCMRDVSGKWSILLIGIIRDNYNFFGMAGQDVRGYMCLPRHVFKMARHFV